MTRRAWLWLLPGAARAGTRERPAPTDEAALNRFAKTYNEYVSALRAGLVDLRLWKRLQRDWERIE